MRKPYHLLLLLLLSSCTVMQKMGIEKRHYRPGFYVEHNSTPKVERNRAEKEVASTLLPVVANFIRGNPIMVVKKVLPAFGAKKCHTAITNSHIDNPTKSTQSITLTPAPAQTTSNPSNTSPTGVFLTLIFALGVLLFALVYLALFPGINRDLALLLGLITVLFIILLLYVFYKIFHKKK